MIRLFYNYYFDQDIRRRAELDRCKQVNLENKLLNVIIIDTSSQSMEKPTYNFFFNKINEITGDDDINIISNSDIYFDDSIALVEKMTSNQVYALSRWNVNRQGNVELFNREDSQDTWIIKGKVKPVYGDFHLGRPGCDNRIAHEYKVAGYEVLNPSKTIKSFHLHNSGVRRYNTAHTVPPPYLTLPPVELCG